MNDNVLKKWEFLINAGKAYWIDNVPTGMTDEVFDKYEIQAAKEDGFFVRDYVMRTWTKGKKRQNAPYIEKITKFKVSPDSTMLQAMGQTAKELGVAPEDLFWMPKYDGSSIALYINSSTGRLLNAVTVGNTNIGSMGVDQTWKIHKLLPASFPLGIKALQCEALVDINRLNDINPEKARQKANGLVNSKNMDNEVLDLLTLRVFRYFIDEDNYFGKLLMQKPYDELIRALQIKTSPADGHITFAPGQVWTLGSLTEEITETDHVKTLTGTFLADGWVCYNKAGVCQRALKFAGAGSGTEAIKTKVLDIQWNDQTDKGKDSWSANVVIEPVDIKGCTVKKPSAGSVAKLVKSNISPGAEVGIILANSTIPMVGSVFSPGNGDFRWPTCECGYKLGVADIYSSLLKCGNPLCTKRLGRMRVYLDSINDIPKDLNLNNFLVIDRFRWENTGIDLSVLLGLVKDDKKAEYHDYLKSFLSTDLQRKNLELVWEASYIALSEKRTLY